VTKRLFGDGVRYITVSDKALSLLDAKKAEDMYRAFFSDAGNFTFLFTGDIDVKKLKRLTERYLASLPATEKRAEADPATLLFPALSGTPVLTVNKGIEEQSYVVLEFIGSEPEALPSVDHYSEQSVLSAVTNIMEIRLRELVREKVSGTYNIGVNLSLGLYPLRRYTAEISFGCEPARAKELAALVIDEIKRMQTTPLSDAELASEREAVKRTFESQLKTNNAWHMYLLQNVRRADLSASMPNESAVLDALNADTVQRIINQYFPLDNYLTGYLLPEK
jgi:zinc protease